MNILEAIDLEKDYGGEAGGISTKALNRISFKIEKGEILGIMGPSGSGKTTLLNILSGIDTPSSGHAKMGDKKIHEMVKDDIATFRRQEIGFVFQEHSLMDTLTIEENIMLPMILDKKPLKLIEERVEDILQKFNISAIANKYPNNISGGENQIVSICRALMNEPKLVFADEPTGNLDSKTTNTVMESFKKINEQSEVTILIVTHDAYVASYCQRVIFIKDGSLSQEIIKKGDQREFMNKITDCIAVMNGEKYDF